MVIIYYILADEKVVMFHVGYSKYHGKVYWLFLPLGHSFLALLRFFLGGGGGVGFGRKSTKLGVLFILYQGSCQGFARGVVSIHHP